MDDALAFRLEVFNQTEGIDPAVVPFVRSELEQMSIEQERKTDAVLGTYTSHLINALNRSLKGEALTSFDAQEVIDAVIAEKPEAFVRAQELAARINGGLGIELPDTEVRILTLHLATI